MDGKCCTCRAPVNIAVIKYCKSLKFSVCACVRACVSLSLSVAAVKMLNILSLRRVVQGCDEREGGAREGEREREGESSCWYQWLPSDFHTCGLHKRVLE